MAGTVVPGVKSPATPDQLVDTAKEGKVSGSCDTPATVDSRSDSVQEGTVTGGEAGKVTATAALDISHTAQISHQTHSDDRFGLLYNNSDIDEFVKSMQEEACKGDPADAGPSSAADTNADKSSATGLGLSRGHTATECLREGERTIVSSAPSSSGQTCSTSTCMQKREGDVAKSPPPPILHSHDDEEAESPKSPTESSSTVLSDGDTAVTNTVIAVQPGRDITDRVLEVLLYIIGAAICYIVLRRAIITGVQRSNEDLEL